MTIRSALVLACLIAGFAHRLRAQELRGVVRDSATRQPISGAVLVLRDSSGAVVGRNITNDQGVYRVALTRAISRMQVLHIGFRPRDLRVPAVDSGIATLDVIMVVIPAFLEPVRVVDRSSCPRHADSEMSFALWEQAKTALLATVVARETNPGHVVRLRYDRRMKDNGSEIVSQSVVMDSVDTNRPFTAWRTASEFVERGFMTDTAGRNLYSGPDAEVLLDEAFVRGYCFHIADRDTTRPAEIGLGFGPAKRKFGRVDIEGAVWIDTTTRSLTRVVYRYVNVNPRIARFEPGGRIEFRAMADGSVIIDRWVIKIIVPDTTGITTRQFLRATPLETHEIGGEVAEVTWPDGRTWHNSLGTLRGRLAVDNPLRSVVRLINTPYQAAADSSGQFEIVNLLPGPYTIGVVDPRLAELGISLKTGLSFTAVRDSMISILIEVPSAERYMASVCDGDARAASTAILTARVNLPDGSPAAGVHVFVRAARDANVARSVEGETDRNGLFHLCHAPHDEVLEIRAERRGMPPVIGVRAIDASLVTIVLQFKNAQPDRR